MEASNLRVFSFDELKRATDNFKHTALLGEGSFGRVYKGVISEDETSPSRIDSKFIGYLNELRAIVRCQDHTRSTIHVAVKRLSPMSWQGSEEWQNELVILGSLSHPNLIKLLGYCREDTELLLVYEYLPQKSLDLHLYKDKFFIFKGVPFRVLTIMGNTDEYSSVFPMIVSSSSHLNQLVSVSATLTAIRSLFLFAEGSPSHSLAWETRISIALGAARGLAFLHSLERPIIHRDFKASDVLLDESSNAKISDFGVAKLGPIDESSYVSTRVIGSGICAPEYISTGHLYVKSDVYNFGVVLLEMLTGLRAKHSMGISDRGSLEWVKPCLYDKESLKTIMDERMKDGLYPLQEAFETAQFTLRCLEDDHKSRPGMAEVVNILERIHKNN